MKQSIIIIFLLLYNITFAQSKKELQEQITKLSTEQKSLKEEIAELKQQVIALQEELTKVKQDNLQTRSNFSEPVTNNATTTNYSSDQCLALTTKGVQCKRKAESGSNYCWQHKSTYEPKSSSNTSSGSSSTSSGRTIYTGPRGGKYYINKNGNKTYIKRK